jgi:hypothetical protein
MRAVLLRSAVCLFAAATFTTTFAEDVSSSASQQDFSVKFQWDSKYVPWKVVGDADIISKLSQAMQIILGHNPYLNTDLYGYARVGKSDYGSLWRVSVKNLSKMTIEEQRLASKKIGAYLNVIGIAERSPLLHSVQLNANFGGIGSFGINYGCMAKHVMIFSADLNHDGHPEVFYFTSEPNGINDGYDDWIELHMLRGNDFKEVFSTQLVRDAYSEEHPNTSAGYTYYALDRLDDADPQKPGERSFETLYFGDLWHQKQMNILVVRYNQVATSGWQNKSTDYTLYSMNPDVTFTKTVLSKEAGEKLADQAKAEGATMLPDPKQNFCSPDWH